MRHPATFSDICRYLMPRLCRPRAVKFLEIALIQLEIFFFPSPPPLQLVSTAISSPLIWEWNRLHIPGIWAASSSSLADPLCRKAMARRLFRDFICFVKPKGFGYYTAIIDPNGQIVKFRLQCVTPPTLILQPMLASPYIYFFPSPQLCFSTTTGKVRLQRPTFPKDLIRKVHNSYAHSHEPFSTEHLIWRLSSDSQAERDWERIHTGCIASIMKEVKLRLLIDVWLATSTILTASWLSRLMSFPKLKWKRWEEP